MIELLREKANWLEDELWKIAKNEYGLERNEETLERVNATISRFLNVKLNEAGLQTRTKGVADAVEDIDFGLAWSFLTMSLIRKEEQPDKAIDLLVVAAEALGLIKAFSGFPTTEQANSVSVSAFAAAMAKRRHAENYALVNDAIKHWQENIDPKLSAQKAASELTRVVPLSHKKLAEIISAEKKKV